MATLARRRLNRAEFYLDLAEQHSGDREPFTAHFETFVVYARSVLHVLKNEVDGAGVLKCFEAEWNALSNEALPMFFRKTRDTVLKVGVEHTGKRAEYTEIVTTGILISDTAEVEVLRANGTVETQRDQPPQTPEAQRKPADTAEGSARYFFAEGDFKDQEIFGICRQYLTRLAQAILVAENCGA